MTDEHERKLNCCTEIEEALVATLDDLRSRMMAKYALDEFDTEEALAMGAIGAGVHLHLRDTFADEDNGMGGLLNATSSGGISIVYIRRSNCATVMERSSPWQ